MIIGASITGAFRTVLIIIGVVVLLRFIGQLMAAKRGIDEERKLNEQSRRTDEEKRKVSKNFGKTKVLKESSSRDIEDIDHEEIS